MKTLITGLVFFLLSCALVSQVPQRFNYQAVVRDADGTILAEQTLGVQISILKGAIDGTNVYSETHLPTTNSYGLLTLEVGGGTTSDDFSAIAWANDIYFIKVEIDLTGGTTYTELGTSQLLSVPYALNATSVNDLKKLDIIGDVEAHADSSLFEVKRSDGQTVFAVYNEGVRMYVDDSGAKGPKGGFAIGGFDAAKGITNEFFRVSPDSVRVYIDDSGTKGPKGGFAIGSFSRKKAGETSLLHLTLDNYFIGHEAGLNTVPSTFTDQGKYNSFIGYRSGTANTIGYGNIFLGYESGTSNTEGQYNVFIGNQAGYSNIGVGSFIGDYNVFIGYASGYNNTDGQSNVFVGKQAGFKNTTGRYNTFTGQNTGGQNTDGNFNVYSGAHAGEFKTSGSYNTLVGYSAGGSSGTGSNNVFIGYQAGNSETGSHRLYIENSGANSNSALIYGEFDNDYIKLNGTVNIRDLVKLQPRGGAPSNPEEGMIYYDSTLHKLRAYNGTTWIDLW